jgi:hypothetical protein
MSNLSTKLDISKPTATSSAISRPLITSQTIDLQIKIIICELTRTAAGEPETKTCLTVEEFRNLWKSLLGVGTFDMYSLYWAALKLEIPMEQFSDWTNVSPDDKHNFLGEKYQSFILLVIDLVHKELQHQLSLLKEN